MMKREKLINLSVRHEKQKEERKRGKCNNLVLWQVFLLEVAVIINYQPPKRKRDFTANKYNIFLICGEPSKYKSITHEKAVIVCTEFIDYVCQGEKGLLIEAVFYL